MARQGWFDGLALGASALCLIHCLVLPLILLLVPTLAMFLAIPESFHLGVFLLAVPSSAAALWLGYPQHRRLRPTMLAVAGLGFLAAGLFAAPTHEAETALTVIGSVLLAAGHVLNWRSMRHRRGWSSR